MPSKHDFHKAIIGRCELIDFVDLDVLKIPAKTDTGAYGSSVHATKIKEVNGVLSFELLGGHPSCGSEAVYVETKKYRQVLIANSFGHLQERYKVELKVKLGAKVFKAKFSLSNRKKNKFPILLGRELLNHRFLVDSSAANINIAALKKQFGVDFRNDKEEAAE